MMRCIAIITPLNIKKEYQKLRLGQLGILRIVGIYIRFRRWKQ